MDQDPISREDSFAFTNGEKPLSELPEGVVAIPLTKGKFALVDKDQEEWMLKHAWWSTETGYANADPRGTGHKSRILMHRCVFVLPKEKEVDHINGNGLDNRRTNLREATSQQNRMNETARRGGSSQYKGVCWAKDKGKWQAGIGINEQHYHLGRFDSEIEAARAYDCAAVHLFGDFANINFPDELEARKSEPFNLRRTNKPSGYSSQYKGVAWDEKRQKWMSCIRGSDIKKSIGRPVVYLGRFDSEEEAALQYDRAAVQFGDSHRVLNWPALIEEHRKHPVDVIKLKKRANTSSRYRGVCWDKSKGKWAAIFRSKDQVYNIGRFNNEAEAAIMYDASAYAAIGDRAVLNFPEVVLSSPERRQTTPGITVEQWLGYVYPVGHINQGNTRKLESETEAKSEFRD